MRLARLFAGTFASALLALLVILVTGGFIVRVGPLALTSHNWRGPAAVALLSLIGAVSVGRTVCLAAFAAIWSFVDTYATAIATVLAVVAGGVGVAFGTYAASSSDASGYVSEAALLGRGTLVSDEPLAREVMLPTGAWAFAPLGYRPGLVSGELVPTYPAGLPLLLAPARLVGGELATYVVVPMLGALAVLCTYALGARLHTRAAGVAAAALLATSPIFLFQIVQPMSDVAATAWWTMALVFALLPVPVAPIAAGAAAGIALLTRPNLLVLTALVLIAAVGWPPNRRAFTRSLMALAAGMIPALGTLLLVQGRLYGSPLVSGYGPGADLFAVANIGPNMWGYAARLGQGEAPALVLAAAASCVLVATRQGATTHAARRRHTFAFAAIGAALVVGSYLPYSVFREWSYLRFLLPAFPLVFVAIGALVSDAVLRIPTSVRGIAFLAALTVACSVNVERAEREQAFNMRRYESRYRLAGLYLDQALPTNAVIVSVQESGSARYYTRRPILRWDLLGTDLDDALAALRSAGRHPFFLVEDWETPELGTRFPTSSTARLDWRPRAEFGDDTRVRLFDPNDRGVDPTWTVDRVH